MGTFKLFLILVVVGLTVYIAALFAGWPWWLAWIAAFVTQGLVSYLLGRGRTAPPLEMHEGTWYDEVEEPVEKR